VNGVIVIVLLLVLAWFVLVRPQRRRQAEQEDLFATLHVGDEVVTAGGLYGTIRALRDDVLELEVAPGTTVRVARRAVAGRIEPEGEADEEEPEAEHEEEPEEQEPEPAIPENDG
jgi:preprotein translocase subunit YajC